jgi:ABC-type branched-subunit amino acid transport system ATPase component/ABC-type branched-subunit amino acid transport system permease subunit
LSNIWIRRSATALLFALAGALLPISYITPLNYIGLYSMVCLGLVLLTGVAGLTSFGQASFVGLGAYTSALLTTSFAWSAWQALPAAIFLSGGVGFAIGWLTIRLSGHYLVLGTMAWSIGLFYVFSNLPGLEGYNGISDIPAIGILGHAVTEPRAFFALIWAIAGLMFLGATNLIDSRIGRALFALRVPVMAQSFGIEGTRLKITVFVLAAVLAGTSGWLTAHYVRVINPVPFGINNSVDYLFMIVVGGAAQLGGAVIGAMTIEITRTLLREYLPILTGSSGNFELALFGLAIIVLLQSSSGGIVPLLRPLLPTRLRRDDLPATAKSLPSRSPPPSGARLLDVRGVSKRFGGLVAVNSVSFKVSAGEIVGLIGPNGAGKTTLFNVISGALPLTSGEIEFCETRIDRGGSDQIVGLGLARTFQHVRVCGNLSALDNVLIGTHSRTAAGLLPCVLGLNRGEELAARREALRQLSRVGLRELEHERARNLALGQLRLLEIARALAADPLLLLLDEPAAGLRYQEKFALAALLRSLREEGLSVLIVEHDMEFVMGLVDRLIVVNFGETMAEGDPVAIQSHPRVIEAYLGADE